MEATTSCCPDGSWGAPLTVSFSEKSSDGANGTTFMIGPDKDLEVYVARPDGDSDWTKKAILVFTDVYGFTSRLYAICDKLAKDLNLHVVAIDCLRGETKDKHHDMMAWLRKHPYKVEKEYVQSKVYPIEKDINTTLEFVAAEFNIESSGIGAMGFCWGAWPVVKASSMGVKFRCGVGFHPSLIFEDKAFKMDQIKMVKSAAENVPLLLCVSGNDPDNLKPPDGKIANLIASSSHGGGEKSQMPKCVEFPDMKHGWVSRGDERVTEEAERALIMASEFFKEWM